MANVEARVHREAVVAEEAHAAADGRIAREELDEVEFLGALELTKHVEQGGSGAGAGSRRRRRSCRARQRCSAALGRGSRRGRHRACSSRRRPATAQRAD
ncbi:MAG: hypothetical protein GY772_25380 [bacterium]|nr:hypothetical protein [bacterium]